MLHVAKGVADFLAYGRLLKWNGCTIVWVLIFYICLNDNK